MVFGTMMDLVKTTRKTNDMNRIITLFFGLCFCLTAFGQSKVDYDNDSRWFWGLNVGSTWSTTDVTKKHDWGWGLTLGKSFNYNYGRALSFDIRGRYLHGYWYGQNYDTTGFEYPNNALSSGNTDYKTAYGYSVLNYQTEIHRASLELVIHANNLRSKTGWDFFVFGGIGYTWYQTNGDLLGSNDSIYRYDQLPNFGKDEVDGLLDGDYETALDGSSSSFSGAWMPSLGVGLGYQVGPRFSIGLEHKTTFTLMDNFDGYNDPSGSRKNDLYHYTSAYVRFQIRDHATVVDTPDDNTLENVDNYNQANNNLPPTVDFRNPAVTGTTVNMPTYVIRADIRNVPGSNNVIFRQNGNYITAFNFNPSTQQFESTVTLTPGQNIFELTGTNNYGSDQEQTIIIYNREQQLPPVVSFINPASSPTTVENPVFNLSASVLNVTQATQIEMRVNGQVFPNFSFNPSNNLLNAQLNLQVGTNIVTITGTNQYGTDSESTTIIYKPQQTEQPPVVYFVDPNVNPYTTSNNTFVINADVLNVAGSQNITFKQNGTVNHNFTYNSATKDLQSNVVLSPGQNVFEIIATNTAGTAQATTIIIFERQAPKPPVVTITNPSANPHETANAYYTLGATVLNVTQASQISVKLNGQTVAFNYTAANSGVTANLNLIQGSNVVVVTGTNNDGTDSKQTVIIYKPQQTVQPPVVTFNNPNVDPFTTDQPNYTVVATVLNVNNQNGVNVNVNGTNISNFSFNATSSVVTLPMTLIEGANVITITGTNTAGTDSEPQTIIYKRPVPVQPPVVSFIDPVMNPMTVFNPTYHVRARVRYVVGAQQIVLRINGQISSNFTYTPSSEMMDFTSGLVPGANIFEITATNNDGQDQKSTTIVYKEPNPTVPPVVTITNPLANPYSVTTATTPIAATVLNVDGLQNIVVRVNGAVVTGATYNASTKQLNYVMNLVHGSNTLDITATNSAGQASDSRVVMYRREQIPVPPVVTFINPASPGTTVNVAGITVKATVQYVNEANQVVVLQNGMVVVPSMWNFNPSTKEVTLNTTLNAGNNVFTITGTNAAGNHTATTNITYTAPVIDCNKPVLTFTKPSAAGQTTDAAAYQVALQTQFIASANQIKLYVNGVLQTSGTMLGTAYSKEFMLTAGQNTIEAVAVNDCGQSSVSTTIIYKPVAEPCKPPVVAMLAPTDNTFTVETATTTVKANVTNINNASQITVTRNGAVIPFTYDNASHVVTADVALELGANTIVITASNNCAPDSRVSWMIQRKECAKPQISLISSTTPDGSTITGASLGLVAGVSGVTSNTDITVTRNGQSIGFVFSPQTGELTLDAPLKVGKTIIVITAKNACGEATFTFTVTRKVEQATPPKINIINPASSPMQTQQAGMTVEITTGFVTSADQVSVTLNGAAISFNFNATNGNINFNATFQEGANVIVATAVNTYGTATDSKQVIYTKPVTILPPVITLTNPASCPMTYNRGGQIISGTITNINNASAVTILYNNTPVTFNSTISGNVLSFDFGVSINATTVNIPLVITATNAAGTDVKTCEISIINLGGGNGNGNNGHGNNEDGNDESNPGNGGGGPNGETGGSTDDENGNNGNGNNGGNGGTAPRGGTTTTKPTTRPGTTVTPKPSTTPTTTTPRVGGRP